MVVSVSMSVQFSPPIEVEARYPWGIYGPPEIRGSFINYTRRQYIYWSAHGHSVPMTDPTELAEMDRIEAMDRRWPDGSKMIPCRIKSRYPDGKWNVCIHIYWGSDEYAQGRDHDSAGFQGPMDMDEVNAILEDFGVIKWMQPHAIIDDSVRWWLGSASYARFLRWRVRCL